MKRSSGIRAAGLVLGLLVALMPAMLLAYDDGSPLSGANVVAQATATAAPKTTGTATAAPKTASPAAPKTGNAGLASTTGEAGMIALFVVLAVGVVAGGRVLASRR